MSALAFVAFRPFSGRLASPRALNAIARRGIVSYTSPLDSKLKIRNGPVFEGRSFGADKEASGEVVFTTSLVGYPESMTDPSYRGQILVFTQPLVGNYGVPQRDRDQFGLLKNFESEKIQCAGIIVAEYAGEARQGSKDSHIGHSHWNAVESLGAWCKRHGVPAIEGVDTRDLTKFLRNRGSSLGCLAPMDAVVDEASILDPNERNLVAEVSTPRAISYGPQNAPARVAVIDCGAKTSILRCLLDRGVAVDLLPWDTDVTMAPYNKYDGLFISNGPGDPRKCGPAVENIWKAMAAYPDRPVFGICMGNLLMGMAAGLEASKLQYGNRGHNQPAVNVENGRCYITSQNHGYHVHGGAAGSPWRTWFVNANDGSNEGIRHESLPFSAVQFHPEARGGPRDADPMFDQFVQQVVAYKQCRAQLGAASTLSSRVASMGGLRSAVAL